MANSDPLLSYRERDNSIGALLSQLAAQSFAVSSNLIVDTDGADCKEGDVVEQPATKSHSWGNNLYMRLIEDYEF